MKKCNRCNIEKDITDFNIRRASKDGLTPICKSCSNEKGRKYKLENKEKISNYNKEYRYNNYYPSKYKEKSRAIYLTDKRQKWCKLYAEKNKEKLKSYRRKYYLDNKDYYLSYRRDRCESDKVFHLSIIIRSMIANSISSKKFTKKSKTFKILGCSFDEFKIHLESKFENWMSWDNYGRYNGEFNYGWDIDHIIPISSAINEDDIIKLNHYTNLQPLCSYTNRHIKKDNIL